MIISTGMASVSEIDEAVATARGAGAKDIVLLKCTSTYPATPENSNILTIPHMRDMFGCQVGLSDHTMGTGVAVAAVAHGATVMEKHFTLSRADGGVDSTFSLEPPELAALVVETERAWQGLGAVSYGPTVGRAEVPALSPIPVRRGGHEGWRRLHGRESAGRYGRAKGCIPASTMQLLGRRINRDAKRGTPLSWDLL